MDAFWQELVKQNKVDLTPPADNSALTEAERNASIKRAKSDYVVANYAVLNGVNNTPLISCHIKKELAKAPDFTTFMMSEFEKPSVIEVNGTVGSACNKVTEDTLLDARDGDPALISSQTYKLAKLWTSIEERGYQLDLIEANAQKMRVSDDDHIENDRKAFYTVLETVVELGNTLVSDYVVPLQLTVNDDATSQKDFKNYLQDLPEELKFLINTNSKELASTPIKMTTRGNEVSIAFSAANNFVETKDADVVYSMTGQKKIHRQDDSADFTLHFTKSSTEPTMRNARLEFNVAEAKLFSGKLQNDLQNYANNTSHGAVLKLAQAENTAQRQAIKKVNSSTSAIADFKTDSWLEHRHSIDTCRALYAEASEALKKSTLSVSECDAYADLMRVSQQFINDKAYVNHITPYKTDDIIRAAEARAQKNTNDKISTFLGNLEDFKGYLGENITGTSIAEKFTGLLAECGNDESLKQRVQLRIDSFVDAALREQAKPSTDEGVDKPLMTALLSSEVVALTSPNADREAALTAYKKKSVVTEPTAVSQTTTDNITPVIGGIDLQHAVISSSAVDNLRQKHQVVPPAPIVQPEEVNAVPITTGPS